MAEALARLGDSLARHQTAIRGVQWVVIGGYVVLVAVPAFLPLPPRTAHVWNNLTLFAQFAFWGVWWPFVLLSMVLVGRTWCGIFCPEGALTEIVSRRSLGWAVPRWLTWRGWPFVAFVCTTVYGQMVSVYQYPRPVLVILGGSTLGAMAVGRLYGRNKRVWCRYLCPVNGVFAVLAKLAPVHFRVDVGAWRTSGTPPTRVNCAPLVPIRTMRGASACHICGRCSGFRDAVRLVARSPNHEVVAVAGEAPNRWETALILFGMMGIAVGAFHWTASPWFIDAKQFVADWLVDHGFLWPLEWSAPWWLLTDYPARNDTLSLLSVRCCRRCWRWRYGWPAHGPGRASTTWRNR
jgi:polyferredoxin